MMPCNRQWTAPTEKYHHWKMEPMSDQASRSNYQLTGCGEGENADTTRMQLASVGMWEIPHNQGFRFSVFSPSQQTCCTMTVVGVRLVNFTAAFTNLTSFSLLRPGGRSKQTLCDELGLLLGLPPFPG